MNKKRAIVAVCAIAAGAWWYCGSDESAESADSGPTLVDQVWIDQVPITEKDKVSVFAMLSEARIGIYNQSSAYEGEFSLFEFKQRKGKLLLTMLQTDKTHKLSYKISNKGCGPMFDYCLEVKGAPRGPVTYGTMRDWVIDSSEGDAQSLNNQVRTKVFGSIR